MPRITPAIYKRAVDLSKSYEKVAAGRFEAGRGTAAAILRIQASRLEVEIHLEQAKAKAAMEGK
jgi:outer membrane protein TolC